MSDCPNIFKKFDVYTTLLSKKMGARSLPDTPFYNLSIYKVLRHIIYVITPIGIGI